MREVRDLVKFFKKLSECSHYTQCVIFVQALEEVLGGYEVSEAVIEMYRMFIFTEDCVCLGLQSGMTRIGNAEAKIFYAHSLLSVDKTLSLKMVKGAH